MPNFHTNNLVIACRANEMLEVFRLIERNLRATQEMTGYEGNLEDVTDVQAAYEHIWGYIDAYYMEAFAPTLTHHPRGVSETACVEMLSQEDRFLLTVDYSTAWRSNRDEIEEFISQLPPGEYGHALLHADEGDRYEETLLEYGAATNREDWFGDGEDWKVRYECWGSRKDLAKERIALAETPMCALTDLDELARACAILYWSEFRTPFERIVFESDFDTVSKGGPQFYHSDYLRPPTINEKYIRNDLIKELGRFPLFVGISGSAYENREAHLTSIVPGSEVHLKSDWRSPYFSPVGIEVFDNKWRSLGHVDSNDRQGVFVSDEMRVILALALPSLRAVVEGVDLKGMHDGRRKHSNIVIRIEPNPVALEDFMAEPERILGMIEKYRRHMLQNWEV